MIKTLATVVAVFALSVTGSWAQTSPSLADDMNPLLGPKYAQWMVGAVGEIASKQEQSAFQSLRSDEEAAAFIQAFWEKPEHALVFDIFQQRVSEADKTFTESQVAGSRTDRGMIFVLYGPPSEAKVEEFRNVDDPDVILWTYDRKLAGEGINGNKPAKAYRFVKHGDLTRLFKKGDRLDPVEQRRRDPLSRSRPF